MLQTHKITNLVLQTHTLVALQVYLKMSSKNSFGQVFRPDSSVCNRLTLCVAVETGVTMPSFSLKYLLFVSGVAGAKVFD